MKSIFILLSAISLINVVRSQTSFHKTFGGNNDDLGNAVQQTSDKGYIIAGETRSYGAGSRDVYLIKLDSSGNTVFSKTFGGNSEDYAMTIDQTSDGGYIMGAHTASFGQGGHDHYLIRTNNVGDTLWTKLYGGTSPDGIYSLHQISGGGYIIGGHTSSYGAGGHDFYLIKTNAVGNTLWTKTYGGTGADNFRSVVSLKRTLNPFFVLVGETTSFGKGGTDILIISVDGNTGDTTWSKTYGGTANDYAYGVYETSGPGLVLVGHTNSFGAGGMDIYVIKTDLLGNIQWSKTYGGVGDEFGYSIQQTLDKGYIIVGSTNSFGAGSMDVYLIKTDSAGGVEWTKTYGGAMNESGYSVQQTTDGGYIITGNTSSFGAGLKDVYVIKTDASGNVSCNWSSANTLVSNSATVETSPDLKINSGTIMSSSVTLVNDANTLARSVCDTTVGIFQKYNGNQTKIYPNPFSESTMIEFNDEPGKSTFSLYAMHGQLVQEIKNISTNFILVERNNLPEGIYFFQIRNNFEIIGEGKLIIE